MTRKIELSQGMFAIIDDDEILQGSKYHYGRKYAQRMVNLPNGTRRTSYLHVEILENTIGRKLEDWEQVDHKNRNKLDCRKGNLRIATNQQNCYNQGTKSTNTSGFKGVYKDRGVWCSKITIKGVLRSLGYFGQDKEAAAKAYDRAAKENYGEFAVLNFPESEGHYE